MPQKPIYFPHTTAQQRQFLFETWQATGNVTRACQTAHVTRRTFYNWKNRFLQHGSAGLAVTKSHAPKNPQRTPPDIQQQILTMRREHPKWGKRRIADEVAKANDWVALVSPNTVKRILVDGGLWQEPQYAKKGGSKPHLERQRGRVKR